jgi:hypothetical protein
MVAGFAPARQPHEKIGKFPLTGISPGLVIAGQGAAT